MKIKNLDEMEEGQREERKGRKNEWRMEGIKIRLTKNGRDKKRMEGERE